MTARDSPFDNTLDALNHPYRRRLLVALLDHNPQDDEDPQASTEALMDASTYDIDRDMAELIHSHLPKLQDLGYITWDEEEGTISKGPQWDEIEPLLHLIRDHQGELPDGWL